MITTPPAPTALLGLEYARILAHMLARAEGKPAYVLNDNGHAMVGVDLDIGDTPSDLCYWTRDQIIFTAPAPEA